MNEYTIITPKRSAGWISVSQTQDCARSPSYQEGPAGIGRCEGWL